MCYIQELCDHSRCRLSPAALRFILCLLPWQQQLVLVSTLQHSRLLLYLVSRRQLPHHWQVELSLDLLVLENLVWLSIDISIHDTSHIVLHRSVVYKLVVLLRWQEFVTRSVSVFFDMPPRCRRRWWISVGVKARVVNGKQVDVAALRSDCSGCPGMR